MKYFSTYTGFRKSFGISPFLLLHFCILLLSGCGQKEYRYVSDAPRDTALPIINSYLSTIETGDLLYIHVDAAAPEAVLQFNEETNRRPTNDKLVNSSTPKNAFVPHGYTVSNSGDIIMPVLGRLHAAGLTQQQLADTIANRISNGGYVNNPQVTVRVLNFQVTVIGEVKMPMAIKSPNERLTIFEALAVCGDVTMYGLRNCVTVVRTVNNVQTVDTIDLTSREILNSPYYYLKQNDIIYVEPNDKRKRQAWRNDDWIRYMSTGSAVLRTAYQIIRYYQKTQQWSQQSQ